MQKTGSAEKKALLELRIAADREKVNCELSRNVARPAGPDSQFTRTWLLRMITEIEKL